MAPQKPNSENNKMRLPDGWDTELRTLDQKIEQVEATLDTLDEEIEAGTAEVGESYRRSSDELDQLEDSREEAWRRVRANYSIKHPPKKSEFRYYCEAAEVLAHYWQGEKIKKQRLLKKIMRDPNLSARVYEFAKNLTEPNSPERAYVQSAQDFLFEDAGW